MKTLTVIVTAMVLMAIYADQQETTRFEHDRIALCNSVGC